MLAKKYIHFCFKFHRSLSSLSIYSPMQSIIYCNRTICSNNLLLNSSALKLNSDNLFFIKRLKHKQSQGKEEDLSDDEDDEVDELLEELKSLPKRRGTKIVKTTVSAMRVDAVIKAGLGISRNKIEKAFYESRIRLNGEKVLKKSKEVCVDDELDLISETKPENDKFIYVSRVKVLKGELDDNLYRLMLLREKDLLIENYDNMSEEGL